METRACLAAALLAGCTPVDTPLDEVDWDPPAPVDVTGTLFTLENGQFARVQEGETDPFFLLGSNLGVGIPGTQPGELALSYDLLIRWFGMMQEMGARAVRIYTLHHPHFYQALQDYNTEHRDDPLYLIHGVWLHEEIEEDLMGWTDVFDEAIRENVNAIHGSADIGHRYGEGYGEYRADISPWVIGWIIGREIFPTEVSHLNEHHPDLTSYDGEYLSLPEGSPTEVWAAERLDYLVQYEWETYGATRPVSFSSWPTLDPLDHPSEHFESYEDLEQVDLSGLDLHDAPGGYFANYHAYPYYPDWMNEDPKWSDVHDHLGPNPYLGYLQHMRDHYWPHAVLIGEYGVPTSWGNAHYALSGMNHGGHDETQQGHHGARMTRNIYDAGLAGGFWFAWMDEWWKQTWITNEIEFPVPRRRFWPNWTGPEQNFGLIAYQLPPPDWGAWDALDGQGPIGTVRGAWDAGGFYVSIETEQDIEEGDWLTIAFDTYADDLGESVLPNGEPSGRRVELALVIDHTDTAHLLVTQAYDLWGIWHGFEAEEQQLQSVATDGAPWNDVIWVNNQAHGDGTGAYYFPMTEDPIGQIGVWRGEGTKSNLDGVTIRDGRIEAYIPWTLLHFTDPSALEVFHDDPATPDRDVRITDGVAVVVDWNGHQVSGPRWLWPGWDEAPPTTERVKPSYDILADAFWEFGWGVER